MSAMIIIIFVGEALQMCSDTQSEAIDIATSGWMMINVSAFVCAFHCLHCHRLLLLCFGLFICATMSEHLDKAMVIVATLVVHLITMSMMMMMMTGVAALEGEMEQCS